MRQISWTDISESSPADCDEVLHLLGQDAELGRHGKHNYTTETQLEQDSIHTSKKRADAILLWPSNGQDRAKGGRICRHSHRMF